jgi:hypothetical protein
LNTRNWWFLLPIAVLLIIVSSIGRIEYLLEKAHQTKATSLPVSPGPDILKACDPTPGSYAGPLVPKLNTTSPAISLSKIVPNEKIPKSGRSTRAGFSVSTSTDPEYWAQLLGAGWYIDWTARIPPARANLEYWPMIRVHADCISPSAQEIQSLAAHFPGQVWIIGNEPDVIWQDDVTALKYAAVYHDLYTLIKSSDPRALIAVGGVSQATPLRLEYLDQVLQAYQELYAAPMLVDWWTVHGYVLREEKGSWGVDIPPGIEATQGELREVKDHGRLDLFEAQLRSFRQWMADHGYQHTPLALTEFGILMPAPYGFPADVVGSYLEQTFTWLTQTQDGTIGYPEDGNHLVQKWAWFSVSDPTYASSDLGDLSSSKLTSLGESFRNMVATMLP